MTKRWLVVASLLLAVVTAACGGDDGGSGGASAAEDGGVVSVTAVDNEFDPTSVNAAAGSTVEVSNDGEAAHNFTIKGEASIWTSSLGNLRKSICRTWSPELTTSSASSTSRRE